MSKDKDLNKEEETLKDNLEETIEDAINEVEEQKNEGHKEELPETEQLKQEVPKTL